VPTEKKVSDNVTVINVTEEELRELAKKNEGEVSTEDLKEFILHFLDTEDNQQEG